MADYTREPLWCVDGVCTDDERCMFCGVTAIQPCRFPKYAAEIKKQTENPVLRHTLSDDATSVRVQG